MKTRNPIARVVRGIRMQVKAMKHPDTMDCIECAGMGIQYIANGDTRKCGACKGTGVAR